MTGKVEAVNPMLERIALAVMRRREAACQEMIDRHLYRPCPADGEIVHMLMQATGVSIVIEHYMDGRRSSVVARRGKQEIDRIDA